MVTSAQHSASLILKVQALKPKPSLIKIIMAMYERIGGDLDLENLPDLRSS